uniref:hypothetical protein n=1 Tax=uncultured Draconibacterium sp. TaxID=1573823 RepID=UPI003216478B
MRLSIKDYINDLKSEKYRASIIFSSDEYQVSSFMKEASTKLGAKYIDLMNLFSDNPELYNGLDVFNTTKLAELLKKQTAREKIVFIDQISFLWDTWNDSEKKKFLTMIEKQWNSFYKGNQATLIFNLPPDYILSNTSITDTKGNSRIKELTEFSAII